MMEVENKKNHKKIYSLCVLAGVLVSALLSWQIWPSSSSVTNNSCSNDPPIHLKEAINVNNDVDFKDSVSIDACSVFSESYEQARHKFKAAAQAIQNVELFSIPILSEKGDGPPEKEEEELTIDIAIIPGTQQFNKEQDEEQFLIHSSGVNGIEGYAGSAIQIAFLKALATSMDQQEERPSIVLIHAINPFGMKHYRQTNENNVDLNRNGIFLQTTNGSGNEETESLTSTTSSLSTTMEQEYESVKSILYQDYKDEQQQQDLYSNSYFTTIGWFFRVVQAIFQQRGYTSMKRAFTTTQYHDTTGFAHGGTQLQPSLQKLHQFLESRNILQNTKLWIDVHTGANGIAGGLDSIVPTCYYDDDDNNDSNNDNEYMDRQFLRSLFPTPTIVQSCSPASASSSSSSPTSTIADMIPYLENRVSDHKVDTDNNDITNHHDGNDSDSSRLFVLHEFGTIPSILIGRAFVLEHLLWHSTISEEAKDGDSDYKSYDNVTQAINKRREEIAKYAFVPQNTMWRANVIQRGVAVLFSAMNQILLLQQLQEQQLENKDGAVAHSDSLLFDAENAHNDDENNKQEQAAQPQLLRARNINNIKNEEPPVGSEMEIQGKKELQEEDTDEVIMSESLENDENDVDETTTENNELDDIEAYHEIEEDGTITNEEMNIKGENGQGDEVVSLQDEASDNNIIPVDIVVEVLQKDRERVDDDDDDNDNGNKDDDNNILDSSNEQNINDSVVDEDEGEQGQGIDELQSPDINVNDQSGIESIVEDSNVEEIDPIINDDEPEVQDLIAEDSDILQEPTTFEDQKSQDDIDESRIDLQGDEEDKEIILTPIEDDMQPETSSNTDADQVEKAEKDIAAEDDKVSIEPLKIIQEQHENVETQVYEDSDAVEDDNVLGDSDDDQGNILEDETTDYDNRVDLNDNGINENEATQHEEIDNNDDNEGIVAEEEEETVGSIDASQGDTNKDPDMIAITDEHLDDIILNDNNDDEEILDNDDDNGDEQEVDEIEQDETSTQHQNQSIQKNGDKDDLSYQKKLTTDQIVDEMLQKYFQEEDNLNNYFK